MIGHAVVLRGASFSKLEEAVLSARHMDLDFLRADSLCNEHVVLRHDDAVTSGQSRLLGLEEVVRVVQVDGFLPLLARLLVTLESGVVSNEDARLVVFGFLVARQLDAVSGGTPRKVENIRLKILPASAEVLSHVKLLVDDARLVIVELCTLGPASGQGPLSLGRMEVELVDLLARVERSQVLAAIFSDPVDAVRAREHNEAVVDRTLHHLLDSANIRLAVFEYVLTRLVHVRVQLLPRLASVA